MSPHSSQNRIPCPSVRRNNKRLDAPGPQVGHGTSSQSEDDWVPTRISGVADGILEKLSQRTYPSKQESPSRIGWIRDVELVYTVWVMESTQTRPADMAAGPRPLPISVSVITLNEEHNLPRCLESIRNLAAEIAVLDSGSVDRTAEIAKGFGAKFEVLPWQGHSGQYTAAFKICSQPWILTIDADEAVTPELAVSIRALFDHGEPKENGFWMNRRTFYLGDWIWHTWQPEWRLRLVRRSSVRMHGIDPHVETKGEGQTGRLV